MDRAQIPATASISTLPAVVFGIDTPIGLTIVRDLGRHGVPVYGVARNNEGLGLSSRWLRRGLVREAGEEAQVAQLVKLGQELGTACLFAVSEGDIAMLNRHRARLGNFKIMFADQARLDSVLNKDRTYEAAARVGVRAPRSEQITRLEELDALCGVLRFPVVLKWANPHGVGARLRPHGLTVAKTHYCDTPEQLRAYMARFAPAGIWPLIQEYCAGYGLGQFVLMKDGQAHYTFQHRRLHEWPPEGGFSSQCESVAREQHAALMEKSIALLRELALEGIAMVEYRYDPVRDEAALMEVNGRFWGSLPLAYHAGASFPWLCYRLFGLGENVVNTPYRSGVRCRFMVPETKRLLRILFGQSKIKDKTIRFRRLPELAGYCLDFVRPSSRYYVFEANDPKPFVNDVRNMLGKALKGARSRRLGN